MLAVSVVFKLFCLFVFLLIFARFRDSQGVLGVLEALGEVWGVSGPPRVGFGTFWGDLGGPWEASNHHF